MTNVSAAGAPAFVSWTSLADAPELGLEYYVLEPPADDLALDRPRGSVQRTEGGGVDSFHQAEHAPANDRDVETERAEAEDPEAEAAEHEPDIDADVDLWLPEYEQRGEDDRSSSRRDPAGGADLGAREERELTHPDDFWTEVVRLQSRLMSDPAFAPRALETAIAWVASRASCQGLSPSGSTRTAPSGGVGPGVGGAREPSVADRAVSALLVAWEQRGSASRAAAGGKG